MEIPIIIEKHCIETETRRLYEKLLGRYFGKSISVQEKAVLENQIDAILFFLENADFRELRHQHSELNGTSKNQVVLEVNKQEKSICIHCQEKDISVPFIRISKRPDVMSPENRP